MAHGRIFYPFRSLDDLAGCGSGTTKFCTVSLADLELCGDAAAAAKDVSTWLANMPINVNPIRVHAWPSTIPVTALYYVWRALRDGFEKHNLVLLASRALERLRQLLDKTAQHELRKSSQLRARQHSQQDNVPQPQRHSNDGNDPTRYQEQTHMHHEETMTAPSDVSSARWQLQEGAKIVCFFAAQLLILASTPTSAAGDSLAADAREGVSSAAAGLAGYGRGDTGRGRSGRGHGRQGAKGVCGRGAGKPSGGGGRLAGALNSGSIEAWTSALRQASGCLDDLGQLVWVHGLQFGSAIEARAVTELLVGSLLLWVPRLPAKVLAAQREAYAPFREHMAGLLCSTAWQQHCHELEVCPPPSPTETPCQMQRLLITFGKDPTGDDGVRCSYSPRQFLMELVKAARDYNPSTKSAAARGVGIDGSGGGVVFAGASPIGGGPSGAANLVATLSEATLLAFDRDPSGGEMASRLLLSCSLMAVPDAAGNGCNRGTSTGGRIKRPRVEMQMAGGADGDDVQLRRLLTEVLIQAVCTAAGQLNSLPVAAAVLQVLSPGFTAASCICRKALLDLAAGTATERTHDANAAAQSDQQVGFGGAVGQAERRGDDANAQAAAAIGVAVLIQGCCDADATIRCRSLSHISSCLGHLARLAEAETDASERWAMAGRAATALGEACEPQRTAACQLAVRILDDGEPELVGGSSGGSGRPGGQAVIRGLLLPVLKARLLDRTRTCRTRALQLVLELLRLPATTNNEAGPPAEPAGEPTPRQFRPSRLARIAARWCLPELCVLLDATYGSPLYDEGNTQLLKQVGAALCSAIRPEELLSLLLPNATDSQEGNAMTTAMTEGEVVVAAAAGRISSWDNGRKGGLPTAIIRMSPSTRRMLASGLTLTVGPDGVYNPEVIKPLYEVAVRYLVPAGNRLDRSHYAASCGPPSFELPAVWGCCPASAASRDDEETRIRCMGLILGGTSFHCALWQQAFRELCGFLGAMETEEGEVTEDEEREEGVEESQDTGKCGATEDEGQWHRRPAAAAAAAAVAAAARMARAASALRVLVSLQRHEPKQVPATATAGPDSTPGAVVTPPSGPEGRRKAAITGKKPKGPLPGAGDAAGRSGVELMPDPAHPSPVEGSRDPRDTIARCSAELQIVLDVLETLLAETPPEQPLRQTQQHAVKQHRQQSPDGSQALAWLELERNVCLLWALRLLEAGLSTARSSAAIAVSRRNCIASQGPALTSADHVNGATNRDGGSTRDLRSGSRGGGGSVRRLQDSAASSVVPRLDLDSSGDLGWALLSYLDRAIPRILLYGSLSAVDTSYAVLSKCPAATPVFSRHLRAALHAMRQQQRPHMDGHEGSSAGGGTGTEGGAHSAAVADTLRTRSRSPSSISGQHELARSRLTSSAVTARYLIMLAHMTRFYEYEREEFIIRLQEARRGGGGGDVTGAPVSVQRHDETGAAGDVSGRHGGITDARPFGQGDNAGDEGQQAASGKRDEDAGDEDDDYMRETEENRGCREAAQRMLERLMASSAPATHAPALLAMLPLPEGAARVLDTNKDADADMGTEDKTYGAGNPSFGTCTAGQPPVELQVLALRALGRLFVMSHRLSDAHGAVLEGLLAEWRSRPVSLVCEALAVAQDLIHCNPGRHRQLVRLMEDLIQSALEDWASLGSGDGSGTGAGSGSGAPTAERSAEPKCNIGEGTKQQWQNANGFSSANQDDKVREEHMDNHAEDDDYDQQREHNSTMLLKCNDSRYRRDGVLAALLPAAVGCYFRLQATGRLQWSPATYRTLAMCLTLARGRLRKQVALQAAALLLRSTSVLGIHNRSGRASAASTHTRIPTALALLRNCPGNLRSRLVSEGLLAAGTSFTATTSINSEILFPPMLRPEDFSSDDLALPVLQMVCSGGGRDTGSAGATTFAVTMASGGDVEGDMPPEGFATASGEDAMSKGPELSNSCGGGVKKSTDAANSFMAALLLMREITPSARALIVMVPQLQAVLRDPWVLEGFTPGAVQVLRDFVMRYKPVTGASTARAEGAVEAAAGCGTAVEPNTCTLGPAKVPAEGCAVPASRGGGLAAQRKLLDLLAQIHQRLGSVTGSDRQRTMRSVAAAQRIASVPNGGNGGDGVLQYARAIWAFTSCQASAKDNKADLTEDQGHRAAAAAAKPATVLGPTRATAVTATRERLVRGCRPRTIAVTAVPLAGKKKRKTA